MYLKLTNETIEKYPYSIGELWKDNPQTSFPVNPSVELLSEFGVFEVKITPQPEYDTDTHAIKETSPQQVNGEWVQVWSVEKLPQGQAETNVRKKRNRLIYESDWTQLSDAPVDKNAWAVYRHDLRSVPEQEGFPWNVSWPVPPS